MKKTKQVPVEGSRSVAVRRALQALERSGKLTPEQVVDAARDEASPLHVYFEWRDDKAADAYRIEQARSLIRSVTVRVETTDDRLISTPVYVRDPARREDEQGYVALASIKDDPASARAALMFELTRIEGLFERAENIATVCGLADQVQRLARRTGALRSRVQAQV